MADSSTSISTPAADKTSSGQVGLETLPFSHLPYLHPSDTQGTSIIQHVLTSTKNYTVWNRAMRIALLGKDKLGFVDGTCWKDSYDPMLHGQWERCNAVVLSWLLNSISKELVNGIIFFQSAHHVWMDLKEKFNKKNSARIFALHRENSSCRQGGSLVTAYFSKLKELWEEQSALVMLPSCTCNTSRVYADLIQEQKLLQFLLGLNESYIKQEAKSCL